MEHHGNELQALADLLKQQNTDSDEDGGQPVSGVAALGPASIGRPKKTSELRKEPLSHKGTSNSKDIWDVEEIPTGQVNEDLNDPRPQPEYDIIFQQDVSSEDMFLQMGSKNPTTASCPFIKISIKLPDTLYPDVELDVTDKYLDCRCPKYKLGLHLPHPVDSKNGKAEWEATKELLTVTLKLNRQYDFLNT